MATTEALPPAFDPDPETDRFLVSVKKRASKNFKRTKQSSLENAKNLAYWLFVFGKDDQSLEVCRFLGDYEFAGNFNLWSWVESTLALQSRIVRHRGRNGESTRCLERINAAGFVASRLDGSLLEHRRENIQNAVAKDDRSAEQVWSFLALEELCVMIELGGSDSCPIAALEHEFQAVLARLRVLQKVS